MSRPLKSDLLPALAELATLFPDWRIGQMIANLALAAGAPEPGGIWEVEDEQLIAAARRLIEANRGRNEVLPSPSMDLTHAAAN